MILGGVILAAGRSSRLGQPKARLLLDGEPLLARLARIYQAAELALVVVTQPDLAALVPAGAQVILGDPAATMIDSLARGLEALGPVRGALVQPVDAAFTDGALLAALSARLGAQPIVPWAKGEPGHPVALPASLFPAVGARPEGGLRTLLAAAAVLDWPDPRILCDLDEPGDLVRWGLASG